MEAIDDIGVVKVPEDEDSGSGELARLVKDVKVVGVDRLPVYSGCLKCSAKVAADEDDEEIVL